MKIQAIIIFIVEIVIQHLFRKRQAGYTKGIVKLIVKTYSDKEMAKRKTTKVSLQTQH